MSKKILLSLIPLAFLFFLTGCDGSVTPKDISSLSGQLAGSQNPASCYQIEETVSFSYSSVRYLRLYKKALIPVVKVSELTKIKNKGVDPLTQNEFYRLNQSWQGNTSMFIYVRLENTDFPDQVAFDLYVDETQKNSLPDFVKNCQPLGGTTALLDQSGASAQVGTTNNYFALSAVDTTGFLANYNSISSGLKKYYFKISSVKTTPSGSLQIGKITLAGSAQTYNVFFHLEDLFLVRGGEIFLYDGTNEDVSLQAATSDKTLKLSQVRFVTLNQWNWYSPF